MTWESEALRLEPVAPATGPFARPGFLEHVVVEADFALSEDAAWVLVTEGSVVRMAGDADLCDYHSPLGVGVVDLVASVVEGLPPGTFLDLDSLPIEAAEVMVAGIEKAGHHPINEPHTSAAVLSLPPTFDEYLDTVGKKQRHELRRKRRRYQELVGEIIFERCIGDGWALDEFIRLHRGSNGDKGEFMTPAMADLFSRLAGLPGWCIDVLRHPDMDTVTACLFSFIDDEGYYLYNSSFDIDLSDASPGHVILSSAIESVIEDGLPRFDFLKGVETYKMRLGAVSRPLYRVTVTT